MSSHNESSISSEALEFHQKLLPFCASGDVCGALEVIRRNWPQKQLVEFLAVSDVRIAELAALALGCTGDKGSLDALARKLQDGDDKVSAAAEHAMWSIWLRSGNEKSLRYLKCGCEHLKHGNLETAIEKFTMAIAEDADFSEAFNQRAIAYYLSNQYDKSIADCRRVLTKMPMHFGAIAGMGHCHAELNDLQAARICYQAALHIHPGMEGIIESLRSVEQILSGKKQ